MKRATEMLSDSGCIKQPTAAVIILQGKIIGRGVNAGKKVDVCPRVVHNYSTGTGYELCKSVCKQEGHCEITAIKDALKRRENIKGANMYLDGHWWICKSYWDEIIAAGITKVFLRRDSIELYKK